MHRTSWFQVFLAFFMMFSMASSAFAEIQTPHQPSTGSATIVLTDEFGAAVEGACFLVTVFDGREYTGCDDTGGDLDGKVELSNIPVGKMTVH